MRAAFALIALALLSLHALAFLSGVPLRRLPGRMQVRPGSSVGPVQQQMVLSSMSVSLSDEEEDEEEGGEEGDEESVPTPNPIIEDAPLSLFKEGIAFGTSLNGSDVRVGIIMARWNADVISGLYKGVNESLIACGVKPSNVFTTYVPGAFELPITAKFLAMSKRVDVIVCLGCLIKGDTMHFEYIASAASQGIMQVSIDSMIPVIFGVLTVLDKQQAVVRSTGEKNEGLSWGKSAVEMGLVSLPFTSSLSPLPPAHKHHHHHHYHHHHHFVFFSNHPFPPTHLPHSRHV